MNILVRLRNVVDFVQSLDQQCHEQLVNRIELRDHPLLDEGSGQDVALLLGANRKFLKSELRSKLLVNQ